MIIRLERINISFFIYIKDYYIRFLYLCNNMFQHNNTYLKERNDEFRQNYFL